MEKAAREVMVLKLNFGTNPSKKEKGLQRVTMLEMYLAQCCIQTVWLALERQRDWNRLQVPKQGSANNLNASCKREAHALPFGAEWSQISDL